MDGTLLEPGALRPTRRMLVVPTLGLVLWAAGTNAGAGFLVVLAGGLVAAVPWGWFTARRAARTVRVRRALPQRAVAGQEVDVTLHVQLQAVGTAVVHDQLTRAVGVVDDAREGDALRSVARLGRGLAASGTVTVEVADAFGLFRVLVAGDVPGRTEVLPEVVVVPLPSIAAAARRQAEQRPRRRGQGSETDGTREYRHGDSPRAVHWRSSARRDDLIVREFIGDASGRVRATIVPGPWTRAGLDLACVVAASLAESTVRAGTDAELGLAGQVVPWTGAGRQQLASLTPNIASEQGRGLPTVELPGADPAAAPADVELTLQPSGDTCRADLVVAGTAHSLGTLPATTDGRGAVRWLVERLEQQG